MNTKRIALGLRYDGSGYHGWQVQDSELPTVQGATERALSRVANHPISIVCAGRTDAGVHATGQVVHFDTTVDRRDYSWVFGSNSNLPSDISVLWAKQTNAEFHARFSAQSRMYRYILYNHTIKPALLRHGVGWYHKPLDEQKMQQAAQYLIGEHDFTSFRGSGCQSRSAVRTMESIQIARRGKMVIIEVKANAFLLHMVRNLVGSLITVGNGTEKPEWIKEVLMARDRKSAGVTIAPNGLYLVKVDYPEAFQLPQPPIGPYFLTES